MAKTIVVQVVRKKAHPFYGRVVSKAKKFYAHDEKTKRASDDVVRLEETRPLSKLNVGAGGIGAPQHACARSSRSDHCVSAATGRILQSWP